MFLFIVTHFGCDQGTVMRILESTKRCQLRHIHDKYHNMLDVLDMKRRDQSPILYDFSFYNFDLTYNNLKTAHFIIMPCRPDIIMDKLIESFDHKAVSYFFNRITRMKEIHQNCPNTLVIPFEEIGKDQSLISIQNFMCMSKTPSCCDWSPPPSQQEGPVMTRYNKELDKLKRWNNG